MAFGDSPTATTPVAGPPLSPPSTPPGYPSTPPPFTGSVGGTPPPWGGAPLAPTPGPDGPRRNGNGKGVLIGLLLVLSLLVGAAGGVAWSRISSNGPQTAAALPDQQQSQPDQQQGGDPGGSSQPTDPSSQFPGYFPGGSDQQPSTDQQQPQSGGSADVDANGVAQKVVPGVVDINTLVSQGEGAGTGMVLTSSGRILTNNHVINGATKIVVTDVDTGKRYSAKVVGTAPTKDVAVLQLENASGLDTVKTGDSDDVSTGDPVVAIGNAGGKGGDPTVVTGSVVAKGRSITASDESGGESQRLSNLIQVTAPIVPGDSGGPLANADGEVIGINSAASTNNQGSTTGEGYAIPINDALDIARQIVDGRASDTVHIGVRGVLGVQVIPASAGDALGGTSGGGAQVAGVAAGSGAERAGVAQGSTITSLDGRQITSAEDLTSAMGSRKPGAKVRLGWTDQSGQTHTATVTLTEGPPD
jgi:S1-C subfamily serine protease